MARFITGVTKVATLALNWLPQTDLEIILEELGK